MRARKKNDVRGIAAIQLRKSVTNLRMTILKKEIVNNFLMEAYRFHTVIFSKTKRGLAALFYLLDTF